MIFLTNEDFSVITVIRRTERIRRRFKSLAIFLILGVVLALIFIKAASAYNCSLSTGSLSRGMKPMPDYSQCPHTNGNRVKVPVCDSECNCYWVTQCQ